MSTLMKYQATLWVVFLLAVILPGLGGVTLLFGGLALGSSVTAGAKALEEPKRKSLY